MFARSLTGTVVGDIANIYCRIQGNITTNSQTPLQYEQPEKSKGKFGDSKTQQQFKNNQSKHGVIAVLIK